MSNINSKVQVLKTNLNTYSTCQNTHAHTHTRKTQTYPQHILQTHRKHIQNIKNKQKHIFKLYIHCQFLICYTDTFSHLPTINVTFSFSHCSLPVGRTSGQNLRAPKPRGHLTGSKLDSTLTQRGTLARGLRPNSGRSPWCTQSIS